MIHGIRVLDKQDRILTFKTYLIYSDWNALPRTHGFGLMVLEDRARETGNENCALAQEMKNYDFITDNHRMAQQFVSGMEVKDFQNIAITTEFLERTWHYLDEAAGKFHAQEFLPQAVYTLEVTDPKWLEHVHVGDVWETTSCDLDGASWYLEYHDDKSHKFYRVYDKNGWRTHYGKIGTPGRDERAYLNFELAQSKVNEKMRKGYELVYRNFDTPSGHEEKARSEAEKASATQTSPADNDAMWKAIGDKNLEEMRRLLESGLKPDDCRDKYDHTALEKVADARVVDENTLAMAKLLLEYGANPNVGSNGPILPTIVYMNKSEELIRMLIGHGADLTLSGDYDDHNVVQSAAKSGLIWLLKDALAKGGDPMHRTRQGHTAMHYAAEADANPIEAIDLLLAHGADLHDMNGNWGSPIFWAVRRDGKAEVVKHLVSLGAIVDAETPKGERAIHQAAQYGSAESFRALVECGADLEKPNPKGLPVMHIIAERVLQYNEEITKEAMGKLTYLREKGYDLHLKAPASTFAGEMISPVKSKKKLDKFAEEAMFTLLDMGFDPYEGDMKGFTLLHYVAKINDHALLAKCLGRSGDLNKQDEYGWTALHYAVCHKDGKCAAMLLDAGIDSQVRTKKKYKYLKIEFPSGLTAKDVKSRL